MIHLLEQIRPALFWVVDYLKGSSVRKAHEDIRFILETSEAEEARSRHKKHLDRILLHATATVPFYRRRGPMRSLKDFPVVTKTDIIGAYEDFLSDPFRGKPLFTMTTSGTTGSPFTVPMDPGKRLRHHADNIYFCRKAGYSIGTRLYYLRVWTPSNMKKPWVKAFQNIVATEIGDLSDERFSDLLEDLRKDRSTKSLLAYSSTYEALSRFLVRSKPDLSGVKVEALLAMSETLPDKCREILTKAFGCPIVLRYSNMENGFLGQQCDTECREYHLNWASYHVEILSLHGDEPARRGELGRIVVTDLFNNALPFIRYDTGDTGVMADESFCGGAWPVLRRVEGRRVDFLYDTSGRMRSTHLVTITLWNFAEIRQSQFIQCSANEYVVKLNCGGEPFSQEGELMAELKTYLGEDARISFEYVLDIPLLASGKRKAFINYYRPSAELPGEGPEE